MSKLGKKLEIVRTEPAQESFAFLKALSDSVFKSRTTPIVLDIYGDAVDMIIARDKAIRAESTAELTRANETIEIVAVQRNAALEAVEKLREALKLMPDYINQAISDRITTYGEAYRPHVLKSMRDDLAIVQQALAATEPATVELPKCEHCSAIGCDGSSHYTEEKKE